MTAQQIGERGLALAVARIIADHGAIPVHFSHDRTVEELAYLFEDPHSIIGLASFLSARSLAETWLQSQDKLIRIVSRAGGEIGAKAWDTYLVLVVEEPITSAYNAAVAEIRGSTRYARKLVISIDDLTSDSARSEQSNLAHSLAPILPLELPSHTAYRDPLATLPERLKGTGLAEDTLAAITAAHRRGLPLIAELHSRLTGKEVSG